MLRLRAMHGSIVTNVRSLPRLNQIRGTTDTIVRGLPRMRLIRSTTKTYTATIAKYLYLAFEVLLIME
ncbi:hypothetical protein K0H71_10565 [Bacillus sp. IITD106]|nr:hypothetical protein [Bacillus sp. IITD106]